MNSLTNKKCVPCEGGIEPMGHGEAKKLLAEVPGWQLYDTYITRTYQFTDFKDAIDFVNRVAECAEAEGHHPDITITYNIVTLTLSTHAINGLSENDFILAAKIDKSE